MFRSFGPTELLIILAIVLVIFGVGKLPQIGGAMGKAIRGFRKEASGGDEEVAEKKVSAVPTKEESK